jgi:histone H1/5
MPPKKATGATKKAAPAAHASYRDMIKDAIVNLKERNGSSRQAIKKYVASNNKITVASQTAFDAQFNKAIKSGVEKGEFTQPKGPSGPLKLAKKEAKPAPKPAAKAASKAAPKTAAKKTATKAAATKKAAPKTTKAAPKTTAKKPAAKKAAAAKPKANSGKARKTKAPTAAPAIVEQPKVIGKTKSGRVTKSTAPPPAKAAAKKRATKK